MSDPSDNDDSAIGAAVPRVGDAHGEAALLLVESLIHELLKASVLSNAQAITIVQSAIEVQCEIDDERGCDPATASMPVQLLGAIAQSIATDQTS